MPEDKLRIAVPSMEHGGLDDLISGHFGHCQAFTLVDVLDKKIENTSTLMNPPHTQGGCMAPVKMLKENGVDIIIVSGIGMRPMMGFEEGGIQVYAGAAGTIDFIVSEFLAGRLRQAGDEVVCGHSRNAGHKQGSGCQH